MLQFPDQIPADLSICRRKLNLNKKRYPPVHSTCSGHLRPMRRHMSLAALAVSTDSVYESEKCPFIHRVSDRASSGSVSGSLISSQILSQTKG